MNKRDVLIFWFRTPPKVSKGAFNYVATHWGQRVIYVIEHDFPEYRKATNWNDGDFGNAEVIMLDDLKNENEVISQIFDNYPDAIHVVSAFTNSIQAKIRKFIFKPGIKVMVFTERPDTMGNSFERFLRIVYFNIKYRKLRKLFEPFISALLPLGDRGVDTYVKYGWARDIMFPFMYNPVNYNDVPQLRKTDEKNIRFLYVGRFYYKTKGIDTLMNAIEKLKGSNWKVDFVGGYGKDANRVIEWCKKQKNVEYLGSWKSEEVGEKMRNYDIVVVPSKYDGWNLLANEAINAGVATIITDEAVSDEIIKSSNSGIVVPARNVRKMKEAMQYAIDNPDIIDSWKANAINFIPRISSEVVGNYFIDIIDYTFYGKMKNRPKCPWI